jgi:hypothetical protein
MTKANHPIGDAKGRSNPTESQSWIDVRRLILMMSTITSLDSPEKDLFQAQLIWFLEWSRKVENKITHNILTKRLPSGLPWWAEVPRWPLTLRETSFPSHNVTIRKSRTKENTSLDNGQNDNFLNQFHSMDMGKTNKVYWSCHYKHL